MKRKVVYLELACIAIILGIRLISSVFREPPAEPALGPTVVPGDFTFSGPYTHDNLTVFLVHGADQLTEKNFLTLGEALEAKKAIVHETENVSQLTVQNLTSDEELFIQAGDIVKGGKQDRTLEYDLIVPPNSGQIPLASMCVENSRWKERGNESKFYFSCSSSSLSSKELKIAARYKKNQSAVWANVAETQNRLAMNVGESARSPESATSLQLTLESQVVQDATAPFIDALVSVVDEKPDVIGYVFAINGKINCAEIYASNALFLKLWPKLLRSSAVEAVANAGAESSSAPLTYEVVKAFFEDAEAGNTVQQAASDRVRLITQASTHNLLFETRDKKSEDRWLHRTYLAK